MKSKGLGFWLLIVLLLSILLLAGLRVYWEILPVKKVSLLVLDKTVLNQKFQEHKSLFWVLKNEKLVKPNSLFYNPTADYMGFFPDENGNFRIKDLESFSVSAIRNYAKKFDAVYFTDMYGIYTGEWSAEYGKEMNNDSLSLYNERTPLVYGGMTSKDLLLLNEMKSANKLIVVEFNAIASPTSDKVRADFESAFGLKWRGWIGRYYPTLDTVKNKELPVWLKRRYTAQHNGSWPFKRAGIAFISKSDRIIILEMGTHLSSGMPKIVTNTNYIKSYELPSSINYGYWFDIVDSGERNDVIARYQLNVNDSGRAVLNRYHIPTSFPAVIKSRGANSKFYYLAGDFSDIPITMSGAKFYRINRPLGVLRSGNIEQRKGFMWRFYTPLVRNIFMYGLKK